MNCLKLADRKDGFPRYFLKMKSSIPHLAKQMKMICLLSGHRPQDRALRIEQYSIWHGARVVCLMGHKNLGGGTLTQPRQTNSECGSDLVNILLQILCYLSFVWILPSNLEVKTKKIKKRSSSQNLRLLD